LPCKLQTLCHGHINQWRGYANFRRHKALTFFCKASENMNDVDGRHQLVRRWTEGRINWGEYRDTETGLLAFRTGLGPHGEIFIQHILHLPNIVVARWTPLRAAWVGAVAVVQPRNPRYRRRRRRDAIKQYFCVGVFAARAAFCCRMFYKIINKYMHKQDS